ncbi:MAG: SPFH domain-containing protein [Patescibacteria group bacterium]
MKIFDTMPQEGTAEAIKKGNKFHRFVMAYEGHHLNDPGAPDYDENIDAWEVLPGNPVEDRSVLGMYWVGIPPWYKVDWYQFRWTEWAQPQLNTTNVAIPRDELTPLIKINDFPYYAKVENAKTNSTFAEDSGELIPVHMELVLTFRCTNPYKARYSNEDWLASAISVCDGEARNYIGERTYEDLASERDKKDASGHLTKGEDSLSMCILDLNYRMPDGRPGLMDSIGIELVRVNVISVSLTPEAERQLGDATTKKYVARRQADAAEIEADGRARAAAKDAIATRTAADAEAYRIKTTSDAIKAGGPQAMVAKYYDSIAASNGGPGKTIIYGMRPEDVSKDTALFAAIEGNEHGSTKGESK